MPNVDSPYVQTVLHESIYNAPMVFLLNEQCTWWDVQCVNDIFDERDAKLILQIPISHCKPLDSWVWYSDHKGEYTVKSSYRRQMGVVHNVRQWGKF